MKTASITFQVNGSARITIRRNSGADAFRDCRSALVDIQEDQIVLKPRRMVGK